jgi:hypothetical protein
VLLPLGAIFLEALAFSVVLLRTIGHIIASNAAAIKRQNAIWHPRSESQSHQLTKPDGPGGCKGPFSWGLLSF